MVEEAVKVFYDVGVHLPAYRGCLNEGRRKLEWAAYKDKSLSFPFPFPGFTSVAFLSRMGRLHPLAFFFAKLLITVSPAPLILFEAEEEERGGSLSRGS